MTALAHLTWQTGHVRLSPRDEVSDGAIARLRAAWDNPAEEIDGTGWRIVPRPTPGRGVYLWDQIHEGHHIATAALCTRETMAAELWRQLAATLPGPAPERPARVPWLVAILIADPTVMTDPAVFTDVLAEAGDLERVVAWALIDAETSP
ncbi:hypothetical protein [Afifella sp. YEN Y35]|uniref:hypothetical protein n=1 Tax=Afifella sp. YEN Y35 TaxID=3388337 RepID=UPI0039DF7C32